MRVYCLLCQLIYSVTHIEARSLQDLAKVFSLMPRKYENYQLHRG